MSDEWDDKKYQQSATMRVSFNIYVSCPCCDETIDLSHSDYDGDFIDPIFTNQWDDVKNKEVSCPDCDDVFKIKDVELS